MITLDEMKSNSNIVFTCQSKKNKTYNYTSIKLAFVEEVTMYILPPIEEYMEVLKMNGYVFDGTLYIPETL